MNLYIICPFVALITCQLIKFLGELIKTKKINIYRLLNGNGGMPSTHTTFISSIAMLIGFKLGFDTPLFALSFITSLIIAYDGMGVRRESGKQANAINILLRKEKISLNLKEQLGHQPLEVIIGYLYGTLIAFLFSL
ncbi:MAG: divergent PAP2 family protein [Bacilli bacterium]|nr:divergent PAP2 family protein [Bacilli bacterium]